MPTSLPFASVTGTPEILYFSITCIASAIDCHGRIVTGSTIIPASERFTFVDLFGLTVDRHVLVDDAEPAVLRHRDRQPGLGDRVHRRGEDRDVEADVAREARGDVDEVRMQLGFRGPQQDVVERQADRDGLGKTFRRQRLVALDLAQVDTADHRDVISQNTFVAHVGLADLSIEQAPVHRNCTPHRPCASWSNSAT